MAMQTPFLLRRPSIDPAFFPSYNHGSQSVGSSRSDLRAPPIIPAAVAITTVSPERLAIIDADRMSKWFLELAGIERADAHLQNRLPRF